MTDRAQDHRPAAIMADTGQYLSYAELEAQSVRLAHLLRAHGLTDGDHVALCP